MTYRARCGREFRNIILRRRHEEACSECQAENQRTENLWEAAVSDWKDGR